MHTNKFQTQDVIGSLLEMAYRDQITVQKAVEGLDRSQKKLDVAANGLSATVASRVEASLSASIDTAASTLLKRFDDANAEAVRAAEAYREAYEYSKLRFAMWGLGITALAMGALTILAYLFLPSLDEIQRRRAERDALERQIQWLQQAAQADIRECQIEKNKPSLRMCAKFDTQFPIRANGYRIISKK